MEDDSPTPMAIVENDVGELRNRAAKGRMPEPPRMSENPTVDEELPHLASIDIEDNRNDGEAAPNKGPEEVVPAGALAPPRTR